MATFGAETEIRLVSIVDMPLSEYSGLLSDSGIGLFRQEAIHDSNFIMRMLHGQ